MSAAPTPRRPAASEYAPFYAGYVAQVPDDDILAVLEAQLGEIERAVAQVPAAREGFRYAPGKWSIREVVGHLADAERVFGYRALAIARGDRSSLPGYDENAYMEPAGFDRFPLEGLAAGLAAARRSNLHLFRHLDEAAWAREGLANASPVTVRALAWITAGHVRHHLGILRERYGVESA